MTPIDDLHVGQWIAITGVREEEPEDLYGGLFSPFLIAPSRRDRSSEIDGRPLQIKAISLPFLCVTDGERRFSLDVRNYELMKLNAGYVRLLKGRSLDGPQHAVRDVAPQPSVPQRDPRDCPNCGDRLVERKIRDTWFLACRQCGFQGGLPGGSPL